VGNLPPARWKKSAAGRPELSRLLMPGEFNPAAVTLPEKQLVSGYRSHGPPESRHPDSTTLCAIGCIGRDEDLQEDGLANAEHFEQRPHEDIPYGLDRCFLVYDGWRNGRLARKR